ncbi:MAG: hypothetical protein ACYS9X_08170 [Planctomycetota bacterium]|jgi:hypothetical protein
MRTFLLACCLAAALGSGSAPAAEGFGNPGFEDGTSAGWTVGGRKDARGTVVPSGPVFKELERDRRFRSAGGWERHPAAAALDRADNRFLLNMSSSGYITASQESLVTVEAGKEYTVSLVARSRNGGRATYYLDVYCLGDDGARLPLGTCQGDREEGELFRQAVTFAARVGEPHVGKRIGLSARYRGRNVIDNARVDVRPIDRSGLTGVVRSLPLVDTVDAEGKSRFSVRGYDDFEYAEPRADAGTFENTGAPFAALAQFVPDGNPEYTLYDLEGLALRDGEAAAATFHVTGVRAYAGFAVDGKVFLLGRHGNRRTKRDDGTNMNPFRTPDYMMYIARVSRELGPETVVIARDGERIEWFACGRKGSYRVRGLSASPRLSLFARGSSTVSGLRKGRLSRAGARYLQSYIPAPRHPMGRPNTPGFPGIRQKDERAFVAAISTDVNAPLADAEVAAMVRYVAGYNGHGFGTHCDPIFSLPGWYVPAKVFLITRRRDVLDHLIRIADPAVIIRNGFEVDGVKYGVRFGGELQRYVDLHDYCPFPGAGFESEADQGGRYFNEKHEYVNDGISRSSDPANARMITPSMAAYCISLHPEIWDRKTPGDPCRLGATYRERAERYVKELALNYTDYKDLKLHNFQTDWIWESYADFHRDREAHQAALAAWEVLRAVLEHGPADQLERFLAANPRPQPKERRAGINRFVAAVSCAGYAARAAETFGDRASMKAIDACAEKLLKSWFNTYQFHAPGHDGEYLGEPDKWYRAWGYQPNCVNPEARDYDTNTPRGVGTVRAEDRAHANFTMKGLYPLWESRRYRHIMAPERMSDLARTFNEMVIPRYDQWRPMPRASKHRDVAPVTGIGGVRLYPLLMFAEYNAELKRKVVRAMAESTYHRGVVMNRLCLAEMRARKHGQTPKRIVER